MSLTPELKTPSEHSRPGTTGLPNLVSAGMQRNTNETPSANLLQRPEPQHAPTLHGLEHPRLPNAAKQLLSELVEHQLLSQADVPRFIRMVDDRVSQLQTKLRTADALVYFEFLSEYQKTRALSGQYSGMVFGPYRVLDRIGSGTIGVVFVAEHQFLKRRVAIKVLANENAENPALLERFINEAQTLVSMRHPHIVATLDAGCQITSGEHIWYHALELLPNGDLETYIHQNGVQHITRVALWGWQAALGLQAAHDEGLVHRDLKPSNILLTDDCQLKISDFGLVRCYDNTLTPHRAIVGSLEFLAPEQFNDPTNARPASDTYSLAVTLFWALTGQLPYRESLTPVSFLNVLNNQPPLKLCEVDPNQPVEMEQLLFKMMSKNPNERPPLPAVAAIMAKLAAPSSMPEVASRLNLAIHSNPVDQLRSTIMHLETELSDMKRELTTTRDAVLITMQTCINQKPGETEGHVQRVAAYSRVLARLLSQLPNWSGYQSREAESELARAATMHDLGLIGIADSIDTGAVSRTPSEEHEYRMHPEIGAKMLEFIRTRHGKHLPYLRVLHDVVRHHHERWDGTGWPDGLKETDIPPAARIVAVADAYDRLRASTEMKRGMSHEEVSSAIVREAGTKFDPEVIEAYKAGAQQLNDIFSRIPDDPNAPVDLAEQAKATALQSA